MQPYTRFQETALLALRVIVAAIFLYAGYAKWGFWSAAPEGMSAGMVNLVKFRLRETSSHDTSAGPGL